MVAFRIVNGISFSEACAGIESDLVAFYLTTDKETKSRGLEGCIDITDWLTKYGYDQLVDMQLELKFNQSRVIRFPIGREAKEAV